MSRVDNAINEIVHIDELANDNQWINKIHPLVKFVICDFSFKGALYRLRFVLPVVCLVGICNPFLDSEIVTYIGQLPVSSGVVSMCTLIFCRHIRLEHQARKGLVFGPGDLWWDSLC